MLSPMVRACTLALIVGAAAASSIQLRIHQCTSWADGFDDLATSQVPNTGKVGEYHGIKYGNFIVKVRHAPDFINFDPDLCLSGSCC